MYIVSSDFFFFFVKNLIFFYTVRDRHPQLLSMPIVLGLLLEISYIKYMTIVLFFCTKLPKNGEKNH